MAARNKVCRSLKKLKSVTLFLGKVTDQRTLLDDLDYCMKRLRYFVHDLERASDDLVVSLPYHSAVHSRKLSADVRQSELLAIIKRFKENSAILNEIVDRFVQSLDIDFSDDKQWFMWSAANTETVQNMCDPGDPERAAIILAFLQNEIVLQLALSELGPEFSSQGGAMVSIHSSGR